MANADTIIRYINISLKYISKTGPVFVVLDRQVCRVLGVFAWTDSRSGGATGGVPPWFFTVSFFLLCFFFTVKFSLLFSPPARWGLLDFIRAVLLLRLLRLLCLLTRRLLLAVQIPVGTAGPQPQLPGRSGHCRTSTASSRSQWALPDLNRELQIPVGTAGPQPRLPDRSGHCRTSTGRMSEKMSDRMSEDMPDRMPEDMPEHMPEDKCHGGDHTK